MRPAYVRLSPGLNRIDYLMITITVVEWLMLPVVAMMVIAYVPRCVIPRVWLEEVELALRTSPFGPLPPHPANVKAAQSSKSGERSTAALGHQSPRQVRLPAYVATSNARTEIASNSCSRRS